jgi:hypothetical protein
LHSGVSFVGSACALRLGVSTADSLAVSEDHVTGTDDLSIGSRYSQGGVRHFRCDGAEDID